MINIKEIIEDKLNDDIGVLLRKINTNLKFTKEKKLGIEELKKSLKKCKHLTFQAQYQNYHLSSVGSSYIYKVPENKRGYLGKFKGKTIRLICTGSGIRWNRIYTAQLIV